jgi:hypothetical protein
MPTEPREDVRAESASMYPPGIRPGPPHATALQPSAPSGWHLAAASSWVLALGVLGALTARVGAWLVWATWGVQMFLIAAVFLRIAWDRRINWLFALFALVLVALRAGAMVLDRTEYQPELDRFEATPLDPSHALDTAD